MQLPLDLIDGEEEYEVEQICAHWTWGQHKTLQYLIKWKGYPKSDNTWGKCRSNPYTSTHQTISSDECPEDHESHKTQMNPPWTISIPQPGPHRSSSLLSPILTHHYTR
jgi:Chromo (CHRromatin Organisation MOdifier) domain